MSKIKTYSLITLFLAGFSIVALGASHLALVDINRGGEDLSAEWIVLRITAIVFLVFITFTVFTLKQVFKKRFTDL